MTTVWKRTKTRRATRMMTTSAEAEQPAAFTLVDLEVIRWPWLADRKMRERVVPGMYVRLLVVSVSSKHPTKVWVKIQIAEGTVVAGEQTVYSEYAGVVVSDHLDLDRGQLIEFGPQHISEWSIQPC
jgi:hypothetical protein